VIEIKSAQTISPEAMRPIANIRRALGERISGATLVYSGNERQRRSKFSAISLDMIPEMIDWLHRRSANTSRDMHRSAPKEKRNYPPWERQLHQVVSWIPNTIA
jgi:hypothetical protein